ncbi:MAG: citramalate synthase [Armatimonadota bacterium]|nr:citramalate synthase [Armatimonadota bacterium]MCX7776754.1 citramalate synthase [Armatimonadota bacterium]MDW8024552.1 citramalate synthase [Armatimonadota bacterium]
MGNDRPVKVFIYDTTLRDGSQSEGVTFTVEDKLRITQRLVDIGVHYIEGGYPASNPKDKEFFQRAKSLNLGETKLVAFGSTCRPNIKPQDDANLQELLSVETPAVAVFGKSWKLHVKEVLRTTPRENLRMIADTVRWLKLNGREVIFDAEHFFDGYKDDPEYALETLLVAEEAGADWLILCDTNGGTMPKEVAQTIEAVKDRLSCPFGIHAHNDSELAVANSIIAVQHGATQVQGTINGYGERCGNANLCSVIPILELKLGISCIGRENLKKLHDLSYFVAEVANQVPNDRQPFVGRSAFAHKGGMHVDAMLKCPLAYEHIDPQLVGNERRILASELSGAASVVAKALEFGIKLDKDSPTTRRILRELKWLGMEGCEFEGADASLELLMRRYLGQWRESFSVDSFMTIVEERNGEIWAQASIKVRVGDKVFHTAAEGNGPVHALDSALREALERFYPEVKRIRLTDYKVRVVNSSAGTAAKVRVTIESADERGSWCTLGFSTNIIEASLKALVEGIEYGLWRMSNASKNEAGGE